MAFLDKTGLQTVTNRLVQGDAIKVASHRGHTVKNIIDNITRECMNAPTPLEYNIENRVSDFKIGRGRDIDARGDIEEGYAEIALKGKTWQNMLTCKSADLTNGSPVKIKDEKSPNPIGLHTFSSTEYNTYLLKPATKYTVFPIADFSVSNPNNLYLQLNTRLTNGEAYGVFRIYTSSFNKGTVITTSPGHTNDSRGIFFGGCQVTAEIRKLNVIILEGDHSQLPIEEIPKDLKGTHIVGEAEKNLIEVECYGKNLFDPDFVSDTSGYKLHTSNGYMGITFKVKPNTDYFLSSISDGFNLSTVANSYIYAIGRGGGECWITHATVNPTGDASGVLRSGEAGEIDLRMPGYSFPTIPDMLKHRKIQLEEGKKATNYSPYKKEVVKYQLDEPLRSLPNGACDEIVNGKLVRRIQKLILNGTDGGGYSLFTQFGTENEKVFYYWNSSIFGDLKAPKVKGYIMGDTLSYIGGSWSSVSNYGEGLGNMVITAMPIYFAIRVKANRLPTPDVNGLKEWLKKNPLTVYYELVTPIITSIDPIKFKVEPTSSISIKTEIPPTSFHTVQLNRAAQIERGITEIAELKNRVEVLETMYDSHFLETAHKLELLGMDYELESEEF